jgi:DNA-binding LacI/PurR family transcriptional regulator
VIVPNLASSYVVRILQGIKSTNRDLDYTVQLFDTIGQKETESQLFQRLARERRIDGAILIGPVCSEAQLRVFKDEHVPCVVIARKCDILDSVFVNNTRGSYDAMGYLIGKGHRTIACVVCYKGNLPMDERLEGYKQSLSSHGIPYNSDLVFRVADDSMPEGTMIFEQILESPLKPSAIFAPAGDMVAIGIIKKAITAGMMVPDDLAVVGYDDLPAAEVVEPTLTTVRQPKLEMGDNAIDLIINKIEGRETEVKHIELPTKFICRNSA